VIEIVSSALDSGLLERTDVLTVDRPTRSVVCKTRGQCQFKYGVKQLVEVDQRPLDGAQYKL